MIEVCSIPVAGIGVRGGPVGDQTVVPNVTFCGGFFKADLLEIAS